MQYYELFDLLKEPFSNSPDPDAFYGVSAHVECLHRLEIAVRLRRGLNVVLGDVGTGKTTLCRRFIRAMRDDSSVDAHLMLDPYFRTTTEFLRVLHSLLTGEEAPPDVNDWTLKEGIKSALFASGVDRSRAVVLIIDEGQKITDSCLECLRELLNYETNDKKLLQIIIFAQREFREAIRRMPNVADRINDLHVLGPLTFAEMKAMIRFRLEEAGAGGERREMFTPLGYLALYRVTRGYPRRIVMTTHRVMLDLILRSARRAGLMTVFRAARSQETPHRRLLPGWSLALAVFVAVLALGSAVFRDELVTAWKTDAGFILQPLSSESEGVMVERPRSTANGAGDDSAVVSTATSPGPVRQSSPAAPASRQERSAELQSVPGEVEVKTAGASGDVGADEFAEPLNETARTAARVMPEVSAGTTGGDTPPVEPPPVSTNEPVQLLGTVRIARNECLSDLIRGVYGGFRDELIPRVHAANPGIRNPDLIGVGRSVNFPVLERTRPDELPGGLWVSLGEYASLQDAYTVWRGKGRLGLRILPCRRGDALRFHLVMGRIFSDAAAAKDFVQGLPEYLQAGARILSSFGSETEFLVDVPGWWKLMGRNGLDSLAIS